MSRKFSARCSKLNSATHPDVIGFGVERRWPFFQRRFGPGATPSPQEGPRAGASLSGLAHSLFSMECGFLSLHVVDQLLGRFEGLGVHEPYRQHLHVRDLPVEFYAI